MGDRLLLNTGMRQSHRALAHAQSLPLDRQRAFIMLFRGKTYESVWNWLKRLGVPRRDRWDILQDVFLAGYQSFPTYDPLRARPERWLNRITVHVAAHYRERAHHRREKLSPGDDPSVADERPSAEEQLDAEQTRSLVMERLEALHAEERMILVEHDIEGTPMASIAEQHGIPLSTAYKWRARAIASLRALLEEQPRAGGRRRRPPPPGASAPRGRAARAQAPDQAPQQHAGDHGPAALARRPRARQDTAARAPRPQPIAAPPCQPQAPQRSTAPLHGAPDSARAGAHAAPMAP